MDSKSVDVVKYSNGKAVEHWAYMDPADMMKMMGDHNMQPSTNQGKTDTTKTK